MPKEIKMLRKRRTIISIALLGVIVISACTSGEVAAPSESQSGECVGGEVEGLPDLGDREITIGVENAYLPFNYIDSATGEPGGWDYAVWPEICRRLNCTPVFQETAWEVLIQSVADGLLDAAGDGVTINETRAKSVDFSIGYQNVDQRLLVHKGEDRFTSIEEFAANEDLVLGTQSQTTNYETAVLYLPEERIDAFETFPFSVQALLAGDVDAVIIDEKAGLGYLGVGSDKLELIGPSISSDELGFLFPKGSDFVDPVNQALQSMMDDGFLDCVNLKFFGPEFTVTEENIQ